MMLHETLLIVVGALMLNVEGETIAAKQGNGGEALRIALRVDTANTMLSFQLSNRTEKNIDLYELGVNTNRLVIIKPDGEEVDTTVMGKGVRPSSLKPGDCKEWVIEGEKLLKKYEMKGLYTVRWIFNSCDPQDFHLIKGEDAQVRMPAKAVVDNQDKREAGSGTQLGVAVWMKKEPQLVFFVANHGKDAVELPSSKEEHNRVVVCLPDKKEVAAFVSRDVMPGAKVGPGETFSWAVGLDKVKSLAAEFQLTGDYNLTWQVKNAKTAFFLVNATKAQLPKEAAGASAKE